mmetsp:Transcript_21940/g.47644  ORF Transcript_21940/g.47644 Transcript_21940/m.47644 type:complete len:120 (+) Transcript_21940:2355-2714(+)
MDGSDDWVHSSDDSLLSSSQLCSRDRSSSFPFDERKRRPDLVLHLNIGGGGACKNEAVEDSDLGSATEIGNHIGSATDISRKTALFRLHDSRRCMRSCCDPSGRLFVGGGAMAMSSNKK